MDKRQNNTNRNTNNGYQTQNNSTTKRLFQKRNYNGRPNRRYVPTRRNRLQRVQNTLNMNRSYQQPNPNRVYNKFSMNTNLIPYYYNSTNPIRYTKREIFIKGLPRFIDNRGLFNLFRKEGRIINCNVLYDNVGFSRGIGKIEFLNYRDAWKVINKWNNATYKGFTLKVEYKKTKIRQHLQIIEIMFNFIIISKIIIIQGSSMEINLIITIIVTLPIIINCDLLDMLYYAYEYALILFWRMFYIYSFF